MNTVLIAALETDKGIFINTSELQNHCRLHDYFADFL